jgi:two-component SAPR family response regulator
MFKERIENGDSDGDKLIRVVIVDDDSTLLKVWEKVFQMMPECNYCITNDPKMAEMLAREHKVDLLISEIVMEHGNGFDLAKEIHGTNPEADILLTTTYNCDLKRFNLEDPHFHILYKPYQQMEDVIKFVFDIVHKKDPRRDATIDEDSWSENESYPTVMEWKL